MKHVGVKRRRSQDYEDFNVTAFPILGIWSLGGFHMFGIGCVRDQTLSKLGLFLDHWKGFED
jgi:hypothetical protein